MLMMAGLECRDSFETALKQDDQPQPLMTQDRTSSAVRGPLWTFKLNIRLLSISIDALLLIIVSVLAAGSSHDITPVIAFGPLVSRSQCVYAFTYLYFSSARYHSDMELHSHCAAMDHKTSEPQSIDTYVL